MEQLRYTILFQEEPEGGFTVTVPALPGCITYGRNLDEAKEMAVDAIEAYLGSLRKHHEPIPVEAATMIASVSVKKPPRRPRALAHA
ncbi:MAG: type II toxin-antitoxin system HicB family antitoxin [Patescibacteria group bacterium]